MKDILLTTLRKKTTPIEQYRKAADQLASILASESDPFLLKKEQPIETPLGMTKGYSIEQTPILVPVLRSGLVLLTPFYQFYPSSPVGIIGIRREEKTATPHLYYSKLPSISHQDLIFLLDPMIATGGTASLSVQILLKAGALESKIILFSIIACVEGLAYFKNLHPKVQTHIVQIDEKLDPNKWIVPGLGDFGDRYFGT